MALSKERYAMANARKRPNVSRQKMRTRKEERFEECLSNIYQNLKEGDLLKMQSAFNLETHYLVLANKDNKIPDLEVALEQLNHSLIATRSHISRVRTLHAGWAQFYLNGIIDSNEFICMDSLIRKQQNHKIPEQHPLPEKLSPAQSARKLLLKIYVERYHKTKTGKNLKYLINVSEAIGQSWLSDLFDFSSSHAYNLWVRVIRTRITTPPIIQRLSATLTSVRDYIVDTLAATFSRTATLFLAKIIATIVILGCVGGVAYLLFSRLLTTHYKDEPLNSTTFETVEGQGEDEEIDKSKGIFIKVGEAINYSIDKTASFDPDAYYSKFAKIASNFNSIEVFLTKIWSHIKPIMSYLYEKITGKPLFDIDRVAKDITAKTCDLEKCRQDFIKRGSKFTNIKDAGHVVAQVNYLKAKIADRLHVVLPGLASTVTSTIISCSDMLDAATSLLFGAKTRQTPVWIHLVGEPGVGKTVIIDRLISWLYDYYGKEYEETTKRYDRKTLNEYWEGYNKNFCMVVDDFLQEEDQATRKLAALEMIYAVNSNPFQLHFAAIAEKKNSFFDSPFVLTTSNYKRNTKDYLPGNLGLTDFRALYRRMHVKLLVTKKGDFSKEYANDYEDTKAKYNFTPIDIEGKLGKPLTINEVLSLIASYVHKHKKEYEKSTTSLSVGAKRQIDKILAGEIPQHLKDYLGETFGEKAPNVPAVKPWNVVQEKQDDKKIKGQVCCCSTHPFLCDEHSQVPSWMKAQYRSMLYLQYGNNGRKGLGYQPDPSEPEEEEFYDCIDDDVDAQMDGGNVSDDEDNYINPFHTDDDDIDGEEEQKAFYDSVKDKDNSELNKIIERGSEKEIKCALDAIYSVDDLEEEKLSFYSSTIENKVQKPFQRMYAAQTNPSLSLYAKQELRRNLPVWGTSNYKEKTLASIRGKGKQYSKTTKILKWIEEGNTICSFVFGNRHIEQAGEISDEQVERVSYIACLITDILNFNVIYPAKINQMLNEFVFIYDVRLRYKKNGIYDFYFDKCPDPSPMTFYPDWRSQCLGQYIDMQCAAVERSTEKMYKIELPYYHFTEYYKFTEVTDFPEVFDFGYYTQNSVPMPTLNLESLADIERSRQVLALIGIVVGAGIVASIIIAAVNVITKFFYSDKSILAQSFDKNTEKRAKKQLGKKPGKGPVIKPPNLKKNVRTTQLVEKVNAQSDVVAQGTTTDIANTFAKGIQYVTLITENDNELAGWVSFVTPTECVTAGHIFKTNKIKKIIFNWVKVHGTLEYHMEVGKHYTIRFPKDKRDLVFIDIAPDLLPLHKDLRKHLLTKEEYDELVMIPHICKNTFLPDGTLCVLHEPHAIKTDIRSVAVKDENYSAEKMWHVPNMINMSGHCGLPIFTVSDKFMKKYLGIHNGGNTLGSYFTPIYAEDFPLVAAKMIEGQGDLIEKAVYPSNASISFKPCHTMYYEGLNTIATLKKGEQDFSIYMPNKTSLVYTGVLENYKSKFPDIEEALKQKKCPAKLKPFYKDNVRIDPLQNALSKYKGRNLTNIPIEYNIKHFKGIFHSNFKKDLVREVSLKEAINGIPGSEYCGPIDVSTSSATGFSEIGIHNVFEGEPGQRKMIKELQEVYDYRKENYFDKGIIPPYVVTGTLKDELRKPPKDEVPRLFCNGSKVGLIEARKYMMTLFEQVCNHKGEGDVYIGINPHGFDWKLLYQKLARKSKKRIIADDIGAWDLHVKTFFIKHFCRASLEYGFDQGLVEKWVLILRSILHPYIFIGNKIFQSPQMPSGSYITAVANSMYNSWMTRLLFDIKNPTLDFDDIVTLAVFGDDNAQSVDDLIDENIWNGHIIAELRKKYFGMNTTSIFKDGRQIPKFMNLDTYGTEESAIFLKRQFRVKDGLVFPALDMESIISMVNWVKPDEKANRPLDICIKENMETALREMAYHGEDRFNEFKKQVQAFYNRKGFGMVTIDYETQILNYLLS